MPLFLDNIDWYDSSGTKHSISELPTVGTEVAIGQNSSAPEGSWAISIGGDSSAQQSDDIAIGDEAAANGGPAIAIGSEVITSS